ncbi:hypothetical protein V7O66_12785 [Methanolobus sp. ZRKC3]|uniref:hypothetical protein n=1 Tax=Methanolobus sp. ZRKC3 TaxID=3125786 RepID=UPI003246BFEF
MGYKLVSWVPSCKKKTIIGCFLAAGWKAIALIAITYSGVVSYEEIKYLFLYIPLTLPALILLYVNSSPIKMNRQDEDRLVLAIAATFLALIIVFLLGILKGNI